MGSRRSSASHSFGFADRAGVVCTVATALLFVFASVLPATAGTTVLRSSGTHDFGIWKASTRNQQPKSKSYYSRGQSESQKRREMYEEMWDDMTSPRVHQSGGYCMYGLDDQLIHAPVGRACAQTESDNEVGGGKLSGEKSTVNHIGQALGKCLKGNCQDGFGLYAWPDGTRYKGNFQQRRQHGRGAILLPSGAKYVGQ